MCIRDRNFLQPLLVAHAEALLLVHNQKPQILEMHVLLQQLVRADDQVNLARRQLLQRLFHLRRCAEPDVYKRQDSSGC